MPRGGEGLARAFYRDVLGLREVSKPPALAARGGCWFRQGDVELHLGVEEPFSPARKAHPAIVVEAFGDVAEALDRAGYEAVPDVPLDGRRRIHTSDPFGNRVELVEGSA